MEIIIAKKSGFCPGVQRAVDTAKEIYGKNVAIFGEIIHNEKVVDEIAALGTKTVYSLDDFDGDTLIIRSHGVGKSIFMEAEKRGIKVIDRTCPFVVKTQKIVEKYSSENYRIIIAGEKTHPEVVGLIGWAGNAKVDVIDDDFESIDVSENDKICLVAQTTYSDAKFQKILAFFDKKRVKTLEVFPTICYTTRERQNEADILSRSCDAMIVIGGKKSSNTAKLAEVCQSHCKHVYRIAESDELEYNDLVKFKKVGIVCGASTPGERATEVFLKMEETTEVKSTNAMEEAMTAMDGEQLKFKRGQKVVATISAATDDGLMLYINNTKKEILLPKDEIDCESYDKAEYAKKVGDEIEVMIVGLNPVALSQKAIKALKEEEESLAKIQGSEIFTVTCTGVNKGGLISKLGTYDVFVPSSQIRIGFVKDLEKYVGKQLRL